MQPGLFNFPFRTSGKTWQAFTDVGPFAFIGPDGVYRLLLSMCGGGADGGNGGDGGAITGGNGGGGSSGFGMIRVLLNVFPGQVISGRVGANNQSTSFGPFTAPPGNLGGNASTNIPGSPGSAPSPIATIDSLDGVFFHNFAIGVAFPGNASTGGGSPFLIGPPGALVGNPETIGNTGIYPGGGGGGGGGGIAGNPVNPSGPGGPGAIGVVLLEW